MLGVNIGGHQSYYSLSMLLTNFFRNRYSNCINRLLIDNRISFCFHSHFACVTSLVHALDTRGSIYTRQPLVKWQARVSVAKIRKIAILTLTTIGILHVALYSWSIDIQPPKSLETRSVCHLTVAVQPCPNVLMPAPTILVAQNMPVSRWQDWFNHAVAYTRSICPNVEAELTTLWLKTRLFNWLNYSWTCPLC